MQKRLICLYLLISFCAILYGFRLYISYKDYVYIKEKTLDVHNMLTYGVSNSMNLNEVLTEGTGHCGNYATLLQYVLKRNGYNTNIIDLSSTYMDATHSVVEVQDKLGKYYTCDPTNAFIFDNSVNEIISNPELSQKYRKLCDKDDYIISYSKTSFWSSIYLTKTHTGIVEFRNGDGFVNDTLTDISECIKEVTISSKQVSLIDITDNEKQSYSLCKPDLVNKEISIDIKVCPTAFSVFAINFLGDTNYYYHLKDVNVFVHKIGDNEKSLIPIVSNTKGTFWEVYGDSTTIIDRITISGKMHENQDSICITDVVLIEPINPIYVNHTTITKNDTSINNDLSLKREREKNQPKKIDSFHYSYYDETENGYETNPGWKKKEVELDNVALVIIDPWKDSPFPELNDDIYNNVNQYIIPIIESAKDNGVKILVFTNNPEKIDYDTKIVDDLHKMVIDNRIELHYYDEFSDSNEFAQYMLRRGFDTLVYSGYAVEMCVGYRNCGVVQNYMSDYCSSFKRYIIPEACLGLVSENDNENNIMRDMTLIAYSQQNIADIIHYSDWISAYSK